MSTPARATVADEKLELLRHALATLAYRGGKAMRGAPAGFAEFRAAETTRTPGQILAHIGDVMDWALSMAQGQEKWNSSPTLEWERGVSRFHEGLRSLDEYLVSNQPLGVSAELLFQGPVADALTHVGQIAMLRRMAGSPVRAENYSRAEIVAGRVGPEQAIPTREFD